MSYICPFSRKSKVKITAYISSLHPHDLLYNTRRTSIEEMSINGTKYKLCPLAAIGTCRYLVGNCRYL